MQIVLLFAYYYGVSEEARAGASMATMRVGSTGAGAPVTHQGAGLRIEPSRVVRAPALVQKQGWSRATCRVDAVGRGLAHHGSAAEARATIVGATGQGQKASVGTARSIGTQVDTQTAIATFHPIRMVPPTVLAARQRRARYLATIARQQVATIAPAVARARIAWADDDDEHALLEVA